MCHGGGGKTSNPLAITFLAEGAALLAGALKWAGAGFHKLFLS